MHKALRLYDEFINDTNQLIAFSMKGPACPSFNDIDMISSEIVSLYKNEFADDNAILSYMDDVLLTRQIIR